MKSWSNICSKKGKCEFYVNPKLLMEKWLNSSVIFNFF
jgi:hypothetical protein